MRATLALLAGLLTAGAGISSAAATSQTDAKKIAAIESATRDLRGLTQIRHVRAKILNDASFNRRVKALTRRDTPAAELALSQREDREIGILSAADNLRKITYGAQVKDVIGVYDDVTRTLYVRNHDKLAFGQDRYILAHEYTHALQDQHFDLSRFIPDQYPLSYRNSDAIEARRALTEGDATLTQIRYIRAVYTRQELTQLIDNEGSQKPPKMPISLLRLNDFPYTTGLNFVQTLFNSGGTKHVDQAFTRPPTSTYVIMHPSAYLHGWKPAVIALHGVQGFADWQQVDDDVLGAVGYHLLLWQYLGKKAADGITDSYRGDRYLFLTKGTDSLLLMKSSWTSHTTAVAAKRSWLGALRKRFPQAALRNAHGLTVVHDASVAVFLHVSGARLTIAYAPSTALARLLGTAPTT